MSDRNKSELTHKVTDATCAWLDSHGFKPVETEVCLPPIDGCDKGWIADLAGLIFPTQTELIEMKMVPRRPPWRVDDGGRSAAWYESLRPLLRRMTCIVEVKTTRGDFLGDRKWKLTPPADLAFLAVPSGLIRPDEYPEGWGILELRGDVMARVKSPTPRETTAEQQLAITYEVAIRRDHRTRYARSREWQREQRIEQAATRTHMKIGRLIDAVSDLSAGKLRWTGEPPDSVARVLSYHGLHEMNDRHVEKLAQIFSLPASAPDAS